MASVLKPADHAAHFPTSRTDSLTVGDLFDLFGPIPLWRIVREPAPGTATFDDLLAFYRRTGRFCELINGILLQKDVSYKASRIGLTLAARISRIVEDGNLGLVTGEQGFLRLTTGRVRGPDIAFVAWSRPPGGREPEEPIPDLVPTLAVEVLSPGNTKKEMEDKLADYFRSGVELVWYVYPDRQVVQVFTSVDLVTLLEKTDTLDGGTILPGFAVPLAELFNEPSAG